MSFFSKHSSSIPLNSLEKFMLAHESEHIAYNSQIVVEFKGDIQLELMRTAIDKAILEIPLLRSYIKETHFSFKRFYSTSADFNSHQVVELRDEVLDQDSIDQFCQKKFDLSKSPAFRFLIGKTQDQKNILLFNVHHTLCDAAGQFNLMEEIFRVMNGMEIRQEAKKDKVFRYRSLWRYMGIKWFLGHVYDQLRPLKKQRQYQMGSLIDHPQRSSRFVTSQTFQLSADQQEKMRTACRKTNISMTEYLTYNCFKALDSSLKSRGDFETPIMVYIPKTLRPLLKIRYSLQNILTTVWIVGKRQEIHDPKFMEKVKYIINSHKMDKAAKFIFGTLATCAFLKPGTLKNIFRKFDQNPASSSSLLISAGRVPRSFVFPTGWTDINIWARGTMLKSPGVGVIFTGVAGAETLTIEYLKDLVEKETISNFKNNLFTELFQDN